MNIRRLPFVLVLSVPAWSMACSDPPAVENPPQPTGMATSEPAPTVTAAETAAPAMTAAPTATAAVEAPPPPKPAKEKIVGKWQFSFEGARKAKAEEEGKKKFAKEKDTTKLDAYMKAIEAEAAGEWIEFADGQYISHVTDKGKDKLVMKVKYEVTKDDNASLSMKAVGKDEISKKEFKEEIGVTFKDDNTISMVDPKTKTELIFKRK